MKVLWFTNIPVIVDDNLKLTNKSGFWMTSLAKVLKDDNVELHIAFYARDIEIISSNKNIHYHPMRYMNRNKIILKNLLNIGFFEDDDIPNYLNIIAEVKPDIIHIHGSENPFICLIPSVSNIPIVLSIQGLMKTVWRRLYQTIPSKYFILSHRRYIHLLITLFTFNIFKTNMHPVKKQALRERKYLEHLKFIIGRTDWDRRSSAVLAPNATYYHCDEIMRNEFAENSWATPSETSIFTIISIASGASYKGFDLICETIAELQKLHLNIVWKVVGISANSPIVSIVKKKLGKNYPERGLELLGFLHTNEMIYHMKSSHVYVMPSNIENGCNALSEAMLLGMPCISNLAGGTGTTIINGETGILLQSDDPVALAGAIIEVVNNAEMARKMASNARKVALARHDPMLIKNRILEIYSDILQKNSINTQAT
jgi:glycosyltransferase involved in cell wall biosynthesis